MTLISLHLYTLYLNSKCDAILCIVSERFLIIYDIMLLFVCLFVF